tara:strand:+ start:31976 stop:32800 length:825 start_codon:yes stop_codon:yes gene_type:complete
VLSLYRKTLNVALISIFIAWSSGAWAVEFAAHRALYRLTLASAPASGGIVGVNGEMAVDWQNACSGWTFDYRSIIDILKTEEDNVRLATSATTWESADGRQYNFDVRHTTNDTEKEQISGIARMPKTGQPGQVEFVKPKKKQLKLPKGTLFPIAHSLAIMRAMVKENSPAIVSRNVFDGMDATGLYLVNAVIGKARAAGGSKIKLPGAMRGKKHWPVGLAYFQHGSGKSLPDHEMKMAVYENGVADKFLMDFQEFVLRADLVRIELSKKIHCKE